MIIRIVKMTFKPSKVEAFTSLFDKNKALIRSFDGVEKLELYRDNNQSNVFFTYSLWKDEFYLEKYRQSELFKEVWTKTKTLFSDKAEAWSVDKLVEL